MVARGASPWFKRRHQKGSSPGRGDSFRGALPPLPGLGKWGRVGVSRGLRPWLPSDAAIAAKTGNTTRLFPLVELVGPALPDMPTPTSGRAGPTKLQVETDLAYFTISFMPFSGRAVIFV